MDDADTRFRRMRRDCGSQDGHGDDGGPRRDAIPHPLFDRSRLAKIVGIPLDRLNHITERDISEIGNITSDGAMTLDDALILTQIAVDALYASLEKFKSAMGPVVNGSIICPSAKDEYCLKAFKLTDVPAVDAVLSLANQIVHLEREVRRYRRALAIGDFCIDRKIDEE
ncbi:MAG TPA: hypothetical protein PLG04_06620 [Anaerolineaceae bacterium]|nr:hypothetical protein [Anaerolineaceae bacterium]